MIAGDGRLASSAPPRPCFPARTRAYSDRDTFGVDTLLVTAEPPLPLPGGAPREQLALMRLCERLLSLAEVAAHLDLPVSLVKVLASDLVDDGHLAARSGPPHTSPPDTQLLQEVLDGLRRLR